MTCLHCKFFKQHPYNPPLGRCTLTGAIVNEEMPTCRNFKEVGE